MSHGLTVRRTESGTSSKNGIEIRDFSPTFASSCSAQAKETWHPSLLPCRKEHVTCAMSLCNCAQPRRIFERWVSSTAALDLNEDDLQRVPAPHDARGRFSAFGEPLTSWESLNGCLVGCCSWASGTRNWEFSERSVHVFPL